jgi:hypothetical protein
MVDLGMLQAVAKHRRLKKTPPSPEPRGPKALGRRSQPPAGLAAYYAGHRPGDPNRLAERSVRQVDHPHSEPLEKAMGERLLGTGQREDGDSLALALQLEQLGGDERL